MPYKSMSQSRFMHSQHPEIAKKWDSEMGQDDWTKIRNMTKKKSGKHNRRESNTHG